MGNKKYSTYLLIMCILITMYTVILPVKPVTAKPVLNKQLWEY